jgi:predicted nuclease of predicted toxin-antitoxin system
MKVKLDENIPFRLVSDLAAFGHDVDTVASEGLKGKPDTEVWVAAVSDERFLITQDLDFSDIRKFQPGTHAGILLVRLREPGANALLSRIRSVVHAEGLESLARCFVVLSDKKLRVRRA